MAGFFLYHPITKCPTFKYHSPEMKKVLLILSLVIPLFAKAGKIRKEDYLFIDNLVSKAGKMEGYSLQFITDSISASCKDELQITRAFYRWCFLNLEFDLKRLRHPDKYPDNASSALMERRAASKGYAEIFKSMCDLKRIECRVVRGLLRLHRKDIGVLNKEAVHYWNIVRIDHTDYLVDPSLCGGIWNDKRRFVDRVWTDAWWLTNRRLFSFTHFPDKPEDQLMEIPLKLNDFKNAPIPTAIAIVIGLMPRERRGTVKAFADSTLPLQFQFAGPVSVGEVTASFDGAPREPVAADIDDLGCYLTIPFHRKGEGYLEIYAGPDLAFIYKAKVAPSRKQHNKASAIK